MVTYTIRNKIRTPTKGNLSMVARYIEKQLYDEAASYDEYCDVTTLRRRMGTLLVRKYESWDRQDASLLLTISRM